MPSEDDKEKIDIANIMADLTTFKPKGFRLYVAYGIPPPMNGRTASILHNDNAVSAIDFVSRCLEGAVYAVDPDEEPPSILKIY